MSQSPGTQLVGGWFEIRTKLSIAEGALGRFRRARHRLATEPLIEVCVCPKLRQKGPGEEKVYNLPGVERVLASKAFRHVGSREEARPSDDLGACRQSASGPTRQA